ncbi:helix-turn-helix domain-containing protein [Mycolicibacter heraklionensis]|uniref:AlbA family DNA-binding domain-containing protein n=1 Tax=Mycolicibacter heraklionensis TaxID=512402 RepID=UPI000ACF5F8F|nr:RNA-binding domain-containing protein [Mycolicibacter heraklionensis]
MTGSGGGGRLPEPPEPVTASFYPHVVTFTPLHRSLGLPPSALTDDILNQAIAAGVAETDDLDWKSELPAAKGLPLSDFPKDIAAMANSGGGMIVYGVEENQKAAAGRKDVVDLSQEHERTLRSVAITAITPPVFGLEIHRLGTSPCAVAVVVPASVDGPHLIYRNDYFGAPIRNDADTAWMKEPQIEAMYRARFDERRRSTEAVDSLYAEAATGRDTASRAWLVAVAHPRIPGSLVRPTCEEAQQIFKQAERITLSYSTRDGSVRPLENIDRLNPRPGLRRWLAPNNVSGGSALWRETWAAVHHDGSVTLATVVGGHRKGPDENHSGGEVDARSVERAVADFTALIRAAAAALHHGEYEVRVGIEWAGDEPLTILTIDGHGFTFGGNSTPLPAYSPVRLTLNAAATDGEFHRQVHQLAQDCVNQGGITYLHAITEPPQDD